MPTLEVNEGGVMIAPFLSATVPGPWSRATAPFAQVAPVKSPVKKPGIFTPTRSKPKPKKPKPKQEVKTAVPKLEPKTVTRTEDMPPYAVILLGDEEYDELHVTDQLRRIVPELESKPKRATEIFKTAQMSGKALVTVVQQDLAEGYVTLLTRSAPIIYAVAEKAD
jgi:ATP-dependent Clp protease adapter protein ClpS